jgi:hypothetical protein
MSERGYIAIARGILDHPIVGARKPFSRLEAWAWLLLEAAWKPRRVHMSNDRVHGVLELERGQLSHSLRFMADKWGWSVKKLRRFLVWLETDQMITTQTDTGQTLITICKYNDYQLQSASKETQTHTQRDTHRAHTGHKEEKGNKVIKDNRRESARADEPEGFAEWYEVYPRKKQRNAAIRAYRKIVPKEITQGDLLARTVAFADFHKRNTPAHDWRYLPYPASWLNSAEYVDPLPNEPSNSDSRQNEIKIEPPTRDPRDFSDAEWQQRLADHRAGQEWPDLYWGPRPGSPGCLVPARLLIDQASPPSLIMGAGR